MSSLLLVGWGIVIYCWLLDVVVVVIFVVCLFLFEISVIATAGDGVGFFVFFNLNTENLPATKGHWTHQGC